MKNNKVRLTTAQFAKLHEVNKRTLHYYDTIGLFSPNEKGENGYRYYSFLQSMEFEYIRMLKELKMSIEEIAEYHRNPTPSKFLEIADTKEKEIDIEIQKLKNTKKILQAKKEALLFCQNLPEQKVQIEEHNSERLYVLPFDFYEDDVSEIFSYVKKKWSISQIRMGIGSYLSLDKIKARNFEKYDGLYTIALGRSTDIESLVKPKGKYLCGYQKGVWEKLPAIYEKMLHCASKNNLKLTGYAYEQGLNEFAITLPEEYITKIMIKIKE